MFVGGVPRFVKGRGDTCIGPVILVYYSMGKSFNATVDWLGMVENPDQDANPSVNGGKAQTGIEFEAPKRKDVRNNPDGSHSTHIMKTETIDGINWVSFPTLFQNEDGSWDDTYELMIKENPDNWRPAMLEAKRRGELIHFGPNKKDALEYGEGSWKAQDGGGFNATAYTTTPPDIEIDETDNGSFFTHEGELVGGKHAARGVARSVMNPLEMLIAAQTMPAYSLFSKKGVADMLVNPFVGFKNPGRKVVTNKIVKPTRESLEKKTDKYIEEAIKNDDWKKVKQLKDSRDVLTGFYKHIDEYHKLIKEGKYEAADELEKAFNLQFEEGIRKDWFKGNPNATEEEFLYFRQMVDKSVKGELPTGWISGEDVLNERGVETFKFDPIKLYDRIKLREDVIPHIMKTENMTEKEAFDYFVDWNAPDYVGDIQQAIGKVIARNPDKYKSLDPSKVAKIVQRKEKELNRELYPEELSKLIHEGLEGNRHKLLYDLGNLKRFEKNQTGKEINVFEYVQNEMNPKTAFEKSTNLDVYNVLDEDEFKWQLEGVTEEINKSVKSGRLSQELGDKYIQDFKDLYEKNLKAKEAEEEKDTYNYHMTLNKYAKDVNDWYKKYLDSKQYKHYATSQYSDEKQKSGEVEYLFWNHFREDQDFDVDQVHTYENRFGPLAGTGAVAEGHLETAWDKLTGLDPEDKQIHITPAMMDNFEEMTGASIEQIIAHEYGHLVHALEDIGGYGNTKAGFTIPEKMYKEIMDRMISTYKSDTDVIGSHGTHPDNPFWDSSEGLYHKMPFYSPFPDVDNTAEGKLRHQREHDLSPYETRADIMGVRYMLDKLGIYTVDKDPKKEPFTLEMLNEFIKQDPIKNQRLLRLYKPKDVVWLMNNLADASDEIKEKQDIQDMGAEELRLLGTKSIKYGGSLPKAQTGIEFQDGGERQKYIDFALDTESGHDYIRAKDSAVKKLGADGKWDGKTYYKIFEDGKYYPHYVGDEKRATIGHGHAPVDRDILDEYKDGINETQALDLLGEDIDEKLRLSEIYYNQRFGDNKWNDLTEREQFMLNDYTFNVKGGFHETFKNFAKAIHDKDFNSVEKEYKRNVPRRNKIFLTTYLKPWMDIQKEKIAVAPDHLPLPIGVYPTDVEGNAHSMTEEYYPPVDFQIPPAVQDNTRVGTNVFGGWEIGGELPKYMDGAPHNARGSSGTRPPSYYEDAAQSRTAMPSLPSLDNDLTVDNNLTLSNTIAELAQDGKETQGVIKEGDVIDFTQQKTTGGLKRLIPYVYNWENPQFEDWQYAGMGPYTDQHYDYTAGTYSQPELNPDYNDFKGTVDWFKDYIQGNYYNTLLDKMRSRANNPSYIDYGDEETQKFMENPYIITDDVGIGTDGGWGHRGSRYFSNYETMGPTIVMGDEDNDAHDNATRKGILAHEFGHADKRMLTIDDIINKEITSRNKKLQDGTIDKDHHDARAHETRSDLVEFRHDLQDQNIFNSTGDFKEFTKEDLKKAKNKEGIGQRLFKYFNDEDIIWFMNNFADATDQISDDLPPVLNAKYGGQYNWALDLRSSKTPHAQAGLETASAIGNTTKKGIIAAEALGALSSNAVLSNMGHTAGALAVPVTMANMYMDGQKNSGGKVGYTQNPYYDPNQEGDKYGPVGSNSQFVPAGGIIKEHKPSIWNNKTSIYNDNDEAQAGKEVKSDDIYANDRYSQSAAKYKKMLPKYQSEGAWDEFEKSKVGKFVDAKGLRRDKDHLMATVGDYFGYESDEGKDFALDAAAVFHPGPDFVHAGTKWDEGKYTDAALYAGFGILPFSAGPLVKGTKKHIINPVKNLFKSAPTPRGTVYNEFGQIKTSFDNKLIDKTPIDQSTGKPGKYIIREGNLPGRKGNFRISVQGSKGGGGDEMVQIYKGLGDDKNMMQLIKRTDKPNSYYLDMSMESPIDAGQALKYLEEYVPKGATISSSATLSLDSYKLMLNRIKRGKFSHVPSGPQVQGEDIYGGRVQLNTLSKDMSSTVDRANKQTKEWADEAVNKINKMLKDADVPGKAKVIKISPGGIEPYFGVDMPNLDLKMEYQKGGFVNKYQNEGELPKAQNGWNEFEDSKLGKFVNAKGLRRDGEYMMNTIGDYFGYENTPEDARKMGLDASAMVNPVPDFINAYDHAQQGKNTDAALYAMFGILPFSAGPLVKGTKQYLINPIKDAIERFGSKKFGYWTNPGQSATHTYNPRSKTWIDNNAPKVQEELLKNDIEYVAKQDYFINRVTKLQQYKIKTTEEIKLFKINNPGKPLPHKLERVDNAINKQLDNIDNILNNIPPTYTHMKEGPGPFGLVPDYSKPTWKGPTMKSSYKDMNQKLIKQLKKAEELDLERMVGDYKWDNRNIFKKYFDTPKHPFNADPTALKPFWLDY